MKKNIFTAFALLFTAVAVSCGGGGDSAAVSVFPNMNYTLGVDFDSSAGSTATFKVWAPVASSVTLKLYGLYSSTVARDVAMTKDLTTGGYAFDTENWNGVWVAKNVTVVNGELYNYSINGTLFLDPYSKSMTTYTGSGAGFGAVVDMNSTAVQPDGGWAAFNPATGIQGYTVKNDAIIYEVHVRDFTIKLTGLSNKAGMYKAFAEKISHVKDLGATHIQLLPVMAAKYGDESSNSIYEKGEKTKDCNYNWGFDPQNYFAPEGMYSANPDNPLSRVSEIRTLVNEAHKAGLGIVLDVVYNHTADTAILGTAAPDYFYRSTSKSGCGNDTASEKLMMRKLIVDSIAHWTKEYKIDGFRFDLMGIIDNRTMEAAYAAAQAVNPKILFLGEGWKLYSGPAADYAGNAIEGATQDYMDSTDNMAVFSDSFRDIIKGGGMSEADDTNTAFLTGGAVTKSDLLKNLMGNATNFTATIPGDCVNYLTAHDGLTLHDKIAKILKLAPNDANVYNVAKLAYMMQMTSQGLIFIHAGCEMGRSKQVSSKLQDCTSGNSTGVYYCYNTYDATDDINGIDWSVLSSTTSEGYKLKAYVKGLIAIRNSSRAFKLGAIDAAKVTEYSASTNKNAYSYKVTDGTDSFVILVNASASLAAFTTSADLSAKDVIADNDEAGTAAVTSLTGITRTATSVTLEKYSGAIIRL